MIDYDADDGTIAYRQNPALEQVVTYIETLEFG